MEKLNIRELLKDCPKGTKLYSLVHGEVELTRVGVECIYCKPNYLDYELGFNLNGRWVENQGECILFPSKENRDWNTFQRPFKDGDVVFFDDSIAIFKEWGDETLFRTYVKQYICRESIDIGFPLFGKYIRKETRFATEEEKQKLFQAIEDNGYRWNPETKTLEKLIEPKFKVGDRIKHKATKDDIYEISKVYDDSYGLVGFTWMLYMKYQDNYELVPNKFDITTLKPFESRVLVRTSNHKKWVAAFYSHYDKDAILHHCVVGGLWYEQCIPYNDETKHLLDTTNDCDEYFKTWK